MQVSKVFLDAGTTYSKIITDMSFDTKYLSEEKCGLKYYIIPSSILNKLNIKPTKSCGHMSNSDENEIIALANGAKKSGVDKNATVLDLGSRDSKWIRFKDGKFHDMDWNTSCASSTGATVEMLLKFYNVNVEELTFQSEKFPVTCGIFGMEKIMDSVSKGDSPSSAISRFIHGVAFNAWNFAKRPEKIYLSGGFCENNCLVSSLKHYCDVVILGRFVLCKGLF